MCSGLHMQVHTYARALAHTRTHTQEVVANISIQGLHGTKCLSEDKWESVSKPQTLEQDLEWVQHPPDRRMQCRFLCLSPKAPHIQTHIHTGLSISILPTSLLRPTMPTKICLLESELLSWARSLCRTSNDEDSGKAHT